MAVAIITRATTTKQYFSSRGKMNSYHVWSSIHCGLLIQLHCWIIIIIIISVTSAKQCRYNAIYDRTDVIASKWSQDRQMSITVSFTVTGKGLNSCMWVCVFICVCVGDSCSERIESNKGRRRRNEEKMRVKRVVQLQLKRRSLSWPLLSSSSLSECKSCRCVGRCWLRRKEEKVCSSNSWGVSSKLGVTSNYNGHSSH